MKWSTRACARGEIVTTLTYPVLQVENLTMHYTTRKGAVKAVENVSFSLDKGEALGLVGESGCGKTSVALTLLRLLPENAQFLGGHVYFFQDGSDEAHARRAVGKPVKILADGQEHQGRLLELGRSELVLEAHVNGRTQQVRLGRDRIARLGVDLTALSDEEMRPIRWKGISMIFQAAMNSLNPVYKVGDQIIEAIQTHMPISIPEARERVERLFQLVGLDRQLMDRYPHEYSGGMKQRAVIAMALACDPDIIIADEPTTALDVIVQDKILREMRQIQKKLNMSMIYISHDIAVIAEVADTVGVMYAGGLVEFGPSEAIFKSPIHPYTKALMSAFPSIKGEKVKLAALPGEPPDLLKPPSGCRFHPRCPFATEICEREVPQFLEHKPKHYAACWNPLA
jgi:peptide/nickel transport system ATP-binding protein